LSTLRKTEVLIILALALRGAASRNDRKNSAGSPSKRRSRHHRRRQGDAAGAGVRAPEGRRAEVAREAAVPASDHCPGGVAFRGVAVAVFTASRSFRRRVVVAALLAARAVHPASSSAIRRARVPGDPRAVLSPADGRIVEVSRAHDPYAKREGPQGKRVHERVQRAFEPLAGGLRGEGALVFPRGPSSMPPWTRHRSRTSATRCGCARRTGRDVTLRAGCRAHRPAHPVAMFDAGAELKRGERFGFIRFGSRVDVYLPLDAEIRASLGDKVYAAQSVLAWVKTPNSKRSSHTERARPPARPASGAASTCCRTCSRPACCFCGFFAIVQAMNGRFEIRRGRHLRRDGARRHGRARRALDQHAERVPARSTTASPTWWRSAPRRRWSPTNGPLKDLGTAGWIAAFIYCAGTAIRLARFNVKHRRRRQSATSSGLPSLRARRCWRAWSG